MKTTGDSHKATVFKTPCVGGCMFNIKPLVCCISMKLLENSTNPHES